MESSVARSFVTFLMVLEGVLTKGNRFEACVDSATTDPADRIFYDPAREVCCDGVLHVRNGRGGNKCCGKEIFDNLSHRQQCCGGTTVYDTDRQMCCGNNVYLKTADFSTCCGNYPMNALQDSCCLVIGSSGMVSMTPVKGRGQCCGLELTLDPEVHACCERETERGLSFQVVAKENNDGCCAGRYYNSLHQVCCGENLFNRTTEHTECCGGTPYNPDIQHCCAETIFPIGHAECCGGQAYHPSSASCCHGVLHDGIPEAAGVQGCCGSVSYLETESTCCDGVLHEMTTGLECCGKDTYNTETHICCAGNVYPRSSPMDACCALVSYDPRRETCCPGSDGRTQDRLFQLGNALCCQTEDRGSIAYDSSKATCCAGRRKDVFYPDAPGNMSTCCGSYLLKDTHLCDNQAEKPVRKMSPDDDQVCISRYWRRSRTYNSRTQACVRGKIRSKTQDSGVSRCGRRILDRDNEICCMGKIHPKRDLHSNLRFCCNHSIHSYVPQHQTCCSGRVVNIPMRTAKCCRNRAYNVATHTCDRSGMVQQISEVTRLPQMCGDRPYHPSEHECCGEVLIGLGQTCCQGVVHETGSTKLGQGMCCGGVTGYDPDLDLCCGDKLHRNIKPGAECCGSEIQQPQDSNHTCCDGRLQSSLGGFRRDCSGGTAYNRMTETVCDGVIHPRPNGACCGKLLYDESQEICCGGIVYPKGTPHATCCGAVPFDPTTSPQRCCKGSLYETQLGSDSRCCGNQLFDPSRQHCCFSVVRNMTYILAASGGRNCNSLQSDNGTMYTLCKGRMHVTRERGMCCGKGYVQDTNTQMCCNGRIMQKYFGDHSICCDNTIVDSSETSC